MLNISNILSGLCRSGMLATLILAPTANLASAEQEVVDKQPEEKALRIVPLVTSTPLTGTGVDLRLDLVTTSENEESVYLTLNQAF